MRDVTDQRDNKLRYAIDEVAQHANDRWPCRGHANVRDDTEYKPLSSVSRNNKIVPYRKYPSERG